MSTLGDVVIHTRLHPSGRWIAARLVVQGNRGFLAVLDTGAPQSAVSPSVEADLLARGLLGRGANPRRHLLTGLTVEGQPLADLEVGVIQRLDRIGVEGLIGLDFVRRFARLHFDMRTLVLTLERG